MEPLYFYLACFVVLNLLIVFIGYWFVSHTMIWQSWGLLIFSIGIIHVIFLNEHAIIRMLVLIVTTFTAMKVIACAAHYKGKICSLYFFQWTAFALGWAGMRPQPFETLGGRRLPQAWCKIRYGISRLAAGFAIIFLAHHLISLPIDTHMLYPLITVLLLLAFSLILHFGLLSISAGMWRLSGAGTYYLFRTPAKAKTLNEFWSKRWNLAFSEMTSITIFRPLKNTTGSTMALLIAFIFSGLLHELALSVPVNSGYGLPLLYFIIQATVVIVEKELLNRSVKFLQNKVLTRMWVFFWLVVPMPLLFHEDFIHKVIWPLAGISLK